MSPQLDPLAGIHGMPPSVGRRFLRGDEISEDSDWHRVAREAFIAGMYERAAAAAMIAQSGDAREAYAAMGLEMRPIGRRPSATDAGMIREAEQRGARWLLAQLRKWTDEYQHAGTRDRVDVSEHVSVLATAALRAEEIIREYEERQLHFP